MVGSSSDPFGTAASSMKPLAGIFAVCGMAGVNGEYGFSPSKRDLVLFAKTSLGVIWFVESGGGGIGVGKSYNSEFFLHS
jgi:hypothetical protein